MAKDLYLIGTLQEYIANLEQIATDLQRSDLHDAGRAAEFTLRLARQWLAELQQPAS